MTRSKSYEELKEEAFDRVLKATSHRSYFYAGGYKYDENGDMVGTDDRWSCTGLVQDDDSDDQKYEDWLKQRDGGSMVVQVTTPDPDKFPYTLADLVGWIIKKKDGTIVRFNLVDRLGAGTAKAGVVQRFQPTHSSLSDWCQHYPATKPIFEGKNPLGRPVRLFVADSVGAIRDGRKFDYVIDGGHVLNLTSIGTGSILESNDPALIKGLDQHTLSFTKVPKILKIDWFDRKAPEVTPKFWEVLLKRLEGDVLCVCQGGHGRSGSMCVILMMFMTDYTPLDAITHLRAIHCTRAIESVIQHEYLNTIGEYLGREQNALEAEGVKDFRARFMTLTNSASKPYQDRLNQKAV